MPAPQLPALPQADPLLATEFGPEARNIVLSVPLNDCQQQQQPQ